MMLPCGHVIAKESLDMHSKGKPYVYTVFPTSIEHDLTVIMLRRMKCPYCPNESDPRKAQRVYV